jgi:hypothetical protein
MPRMNCAPFTIVAQQNPRIEPEKGARFSVCVSHTAYAALWKNALEAP